MDNFDSFSSSHSIDELKEHSMKVHEIVSEGLDENSIIDYLQTKVNEVIRTKEELCAVKAELKMQKETNQLLEAEFAFRKDEYEKEIQKLRENEEKLKAELVATKTSSTQKIDVEAVLTQEREKYEKKTKDLESKVHELEASLEKSQASQQSLLDMSHLSDNLQSKIERRNKKIEQLVTAIQEKDSAIAEKEKTIAQMKAQLSDKDSMICDLKSKSQISDPESVIIEKLKNRLIRAKGKIEELKQIENQNLKFNELVNHYDTEREILCDILHTSDADGSGEWTNLRAKTREAANAIEELAKLKNKLEKTEAALTETQSTLKETNELEEQLSKSNEQVKSLMQMKDQLSSVIIENNVLKAKAVTSERLSNLQCLRTRSATALSKCQKELTDDICELHKAIFNSTFDTIRPLVLLSVFVTRWRNVAKKQVSDVIDPLALISFTSSCGLSIHEKLHDIREEFVKVTNELVEVKAKLCKSEEKRVAMKQTIFDQQKAYEESYEKLKREKSIADALKKRMVDLQKELSLLIPSDKFEEMKTKYAELEIENEKLKAEIAQLEQITSDQSIAVCELRTKLIAAEASSHFSGKKMERMKDIAEKKEREADILDARLREKTKDMLALERFAIQSDNNPFKKGLDKSEPQKFPNINQKFIPNI